MTQSEISLLRYGLIWFLEYYELCRGINAGDNRTVPWPHLCAKGAGSEADWGIVNGKATTDVRIIGAVGNPSAPAGHLPLHKGGKGAVRTQRRHPVGACCRAQRILNLNDCRWQSYLDS